MTSRSLIGTELDQIPVNAMLGGLAYQSSENATIKNLDLRNIAEINAETADTAVDIFVYDTSKDSDGGAWRQRTSHTSWYNETLNTATRGSRREFPSVAICVAENFKLTIYDGDDPDLPMWMVFNADTSAWNSNATFLSLAYSPGSGMNITSVKCLNAKLVVSGSQHGLVTIDFINESQNNRRPDLGSYVVSHRKSGAIALRNDTSGQVPTTDTGLIVDRFVNDVAMTVLPLAPIDPDTGLQVPTIVVGTNDGVSVIKDDGTVISTASSSSGYHIEKVDFTEEYGLNAHIDSSSGSNKAVVYVKDYESINALSYATYSNWDGVLYASRYAANVLTYRTLSQGSGFPISDVTSMSGTDAAVGSNFTAGGLTLLAKNNEAPGLGMVAFVTSDYNTGYMQGDIKGAFLSDTTAESFSATNLVSEDFSANWTGATNGVLSVSNGQLTITNSGGGNGRAQSNTFATTSGKKYAFIVKAVSKSSATYRLEVRGPELVVEGTTDGQTLVIYFNGTGNSSTFVELYAIGSSGASVTYEDAYVVEIEEDRSINNKGLQVFGTVTKSAVATGAELVAYGGFSSSNYLQQPHNSDLAPGTGAYSVTCWFKTGTSSSDQYIFDRASGSTGSRNLLLIMHSNASGSSANKFQWWHRDSSGSYTDIQITDKDVTDNAWHQVVALYDGSTYKVYVDGSVSSVTSSVGRNVGNDGTPAMYVGVRHSLSSPISGSLALFRYSSSAPSPEQIKKIYEDEKVLFQENAASTLYGSSDAVTALAYDDSTSLLHAGTSSGRSDFTGLKRINHDTSAVSTAISAKDGLIAQQ